MAAIGRLWIAVNADAKPALAQIAKLDTAMRNTATQARNLGGASGQGMDKTTQATNKAAQSATKLGTAANKAAGDVKKLGSAAGDVGRPLNQLQTSMYRLSQSFINMRYGNPIGTIVGLTQSMGGMAGAARGAASGMGVVATGMAGVAVAGAALVGGVVLAGAAMAKFGLQMAAQFETLNIQFTGLLGSAERATEEMQFLLTLGSQSVVPTEQLMEADRLLLAYGVTADGTRRHLVKFMSDFGSATGISNAKLGDMAYALGQIQSQGRANQIDLRQLAVAGLNLATVYEKVAKQQGISVSAAQKLASEGKLTSSVLIPAIISMGDSYADAGQKAAQSTQGLLANIKDIAKIKLGTAFEGLLEKLKPILQWVMDFLRAFDFAPIAAAFGNLFSYISEAFADVDANSTDSALNIADTIGNIVNVVAFALKKMLQYWGFLFNGVNAIWQAIIAVVMSTLGSVVDNMATIVGWLATVGEAVGMSWGEGLRSAEQSMVNFATTANSAANSAAQSMIGAAKASAAAFGGLITDWDFKSIPKAKITPSEPLDLGKLGGFGGGGDDDGNSGGKGKKKTDDLIARLKKLAETVTALQDLTRRPFGEKSFIQKEFGDISSADKIISAFDKTKKAVVDFYEASAAVASKAGKASLGKQKNSTLKNLREQTQTLVNLANENKRLAKELDDWRKAEGLRVQSDIDSLKNTYEGYNDARGYAVKGLIQNAQDALDAATQAYDDANSKLQDLISARDDFLNSIRESARSFVNALSVSSEMVQEYTRLDDVGSFMINEKQKSASLKEQMASRLETVKKFAENMKILMAQGLNGQLLQDLVNAGPEAAGDAMQELVNGGQASIDEINQIQSELDAVIGGIQGSASAAWFDPAINIQQGVVNQLAAQKAAAEQALLDAQASYNMRLAQYEAYQASIEAGTDAHSLALTERIKTNEEAAQAIADGMQAKLAWLTDPKNKKNTDVLGNAAIEGFIAGMKSQRQAAVNAAQDIADAVSSTIANAFKIKSPSRLMMQYGSWVSEGLAIGMESALPKVEAASLRMSQAALPSISGDGPGAPTVIVKIGERELTDIVNTEVISHDQRQVDFVLAGRR